MVTFHLSCKFSGEKHIGQLTLFIADQRTVRTLVIKQIIKFNLSCVKILTIVTIYYANMYTLSIKFWHFVITFHYNMIVSLYTQTFYTVWSDKTPFMHAADI